MAKLATLAVAMLVSLAVLRVDTYHERIAAPNPMATEGRECLHPSGETGICSKMSNCPGEFEAVTKGGESSPVCSFQGSIAIICCIAGRKSVEACETLRARIPNLGGFTSISNGIIATAKFPHMALLGYNVVGPLPQVRPQDEGPWKCGGSLISEQFVLTAAHCMVTKHGNVSKIRLGAKNWRLPDGNEQDFDIDSVIVHPDYSPSAWYNDIALVKLSRKVKLTSNIYPACLYTNSKEPKSLIISGWGQTDPNTQEFNDHLLEGKNELKWVNSLDCTRSYNRTGTTEGSIPNGVNAMMFCATDNSSLTELSTDTCRGDSGGPIQLRHYMDASGEAFVTYDVVGVTSGGAICGGEPPGIYTRVYYYLDWIERIIYQS